MATSKSQGTTPIQVRAGYASVNDLEMYYEVHGTGEPLLLLHGQFASIEMFAKILPLLARSRRVVAVEQTTSGRSASWRSAASASNE